MNDNFVNDVMGGLKKWRQNKKAANRESSTAILREAGIPFQSFNNGGNLLVKNNFDFSPSTGLIVDRRTGQRYRGVRVLLKLIAGKPLDEFEQVSGNR